MERHDRRVIRVIAFVLLSVSFPLVSGCAPSGSTDGGSSSAGSNPAPESGVAAAVIDEVATASSGRVVQIYTSEIPADVGSSTSMSMDVGSPTSMSMSIDATFDRSALAVEGEFDFHTDPEDVLLTAWPEGVPVGLRVRVIGDDVWAAQGVVADLKPFRDITPAADRALPVAQLTTISSVVDLVGDAVDMDAPEPVAGTSTTWRGVVPPEALGDIWEQPGYVGSVTRLAGAIPVAHLDGVFVYEVERSEEGWIRISLWMDVPRLAANLDEPMTGTVRSRVDTTWSALGEPVSIPRPESVAE